MNKIDYKLDEIVFKADNLKLKGWLHLPSTYKPSVIIGSHGFLSTGNSPKQIELAKRCCDVGIGFFRFDHRGCGESEGDFNKVTSLVGRCTDLISAINMILNLEETSNKIALFGSSMGGAVVLKVAGDNKQIDIQSIVTLATPIRGDSIVIPTAQKKEFPSEFFEKNLHFDISSGLKNISKILIFHGEADKIVPLENGMEIFRKVKDPKKIIVMENGDHRVSNNKHQEDFIKLSVNWYQRMNVEL